MLKLFQSFFVIVSLFILSSNCAQARDTWVKIATQVVEPGTKIASIKIPDDATAKSLRLALPKGKLLLSAIVVTYGEGRVHLEDRRINLLEGERTRPMRLASNEQPIRGVNIVASPEADVEGAMIEVWALVSEGTAVTAPARPKIVARTDDTETDRPVAAAETQRRLAAKDAEVRRWTAELQRRQRALRQRSRLAQRKWSGRERAYRRPSAEARDRVAQAARNAQRARAERERLQRELAQANEQSQRTGRAKSATRGIVAERSMEKSGGDPSVAPPANRAPVTKRFSYSVETLDACVAAKTCTAIPVFFGTDRNQTMAQERISFGTERASRVQLGRVFVTVPRNNRTPGQLNLPTTWDWLRGVPAIGDPERHFTIPKKGITLYGSEDDFVAAVKEHIQSGSGTNRDHAFVYVHGYRVPWEFAAMRTAQIAYDLSPDDAPFGTPFFYSWPSQGAAADYITDLDSSRLAIPYIRDFLKMVVEKTGASHVHIIAHSMGNFPVIHALSEISRSYPDIKFSQLVLAAPDVDKSEFETLGADVAKTAAGVTLYASASDIALLFSRWTRSDKPRAGDAKVPPGPAIVAGIDTVDISLLSTGFFSYFSWNHDKYADSPILLNDISNLFREGVHPPSLRNIRFRPVTQTADAIFWRFSQ